jgi:RHS repeat-associated protein
VFIPNNDQNTNPTSWYQQYGYDALNRLTQVHEYTGNTANDWQQAYGYDRYGNRTINNNSNATWGQNINNVVATVDTSTNRVYATNDSSHAYVDYDLAGNQTKDYLTSNGTRIFDAENQMILATNSAGDNEYSYDGEGKRVKRYVAAEDTETWQVYGLGGELIAEYDGEDNDPSAPKKEYGYRNGQLLVIAEPAPPCPEIGPCWFEEGGEDDTGGSTPVHWLITDQLGTPRMIFDQSGSLANVSRHDYLPFGEELFTAGRTPGLGYTSSDSVRQKFTQKERDNETGLDYFINRYYGSTQGRFTSADPAMVSLARMVDPQQLNLYSYVRNKPLSLIDPDGREIWILFEDTNAKGKHFTNRVRYSDGKLYTKDGKEYTGDNSYALKVQIDLNKLAKSGDDVLQTRIQVLTNSKNIHNIQLTPEDGKGDRNRPNSEKKDREGKPTGTTTFFNPDSTKNVRGEDAPPVSTLAHELLGHGFDSDQGETDHDKTPNGIPMSEVHAVNIENRARATIGAPIRNSYGNKPIPDQLLYDPYRRRL